MKIGLSLPVSYLAGKYNNVESEILKNAFGESHLFLAQLKKNGICSIEMKIVNEGTSSQIVDIALRNILQADLDYSMHLYLPTDVTSRKSFSEIYPFLGLVIAHIQNSNAVITVHPYLSKEFDMAKLAILSGQALAYIASISEKENINICLAIELLRGNSLSSPTATYNSILKILKYIDHPQVGICWDIGHSYWNTLNKELNDIPPKEFLDKTIHTHIHDLGPEGTHSSLSNGIVPIRKMLSSLVLNEYSGVFNLELRPSLLLPDIQNEIFFSIKKIQEILTSFAKEI